MIGSVVSILLFVILFSCVGTNVSQETSPPVSEMSQDNADEKGVVTKAHPTRISGKVISVDVSARTVTVKTKKKEITLRVTEKTKITAGGEEREFSDLTNGDELTLVAQEEEGEMVARAIRVSAFNEGE